MYVHCFPARIAHSTKSGCLPERKQNRALRSPTRGINSRQGLPTRCKRVEHGGPRFQSLSLSPRLQKRSSARGAARLACSSVTRIAFPLGPRTHCHTSPSFLGHHLLRCLALQQETIMSLLSFHDDALLSILGCLPQADLCTLCLVHSRIHGLAQPLLYSAIRFGWQLRCWDQPYRHPITSFVRSILLKPDLAAHVRAILCDITPQKLQTSPSNKAAPLVVPDSDLREAAAFVGRCHQVPYRDAWLEELRNARVAVK
ncbi:hypothetical protein VTK26DRAFT_9222 [Humicola hyalothermophila]